MQNVLKLFGVKATDSFDEHFRSSLWKLTILYTAVLAVILLTSSGVLYSAFSQKLERRYRDFRVISQARPPGFVFVQPPPLTRQEVQSELVYSLILVNGLLLFVAGVSSYFLAHLTLRPIKDAYDTQRQFFADASHELRTPLSILKLDLENEITDIQTPAIARAKAQSHLEEVDRMSTMVGDLLVLSRLHSEEANSQVTPAVMNLSSLVRELFERIKPLAAQHEVTMSLQESSGDITLSSDEQLLSRAILNVIKNAILYNKPQGTVDIQVIAKGTIAQIIVTDTGIGLAPKDLSHIFERFYRTNKSRSRASGGSGLGLPIVRSSIERLGGAVYVKSTLNQGTVVTLELPL